MQLEVATEAETEIAVRWQAAYNSRMSTRQANATENAPKALGPYSQAITSSAQKTVYVSGQTPIDPKTGELVKGIEAQTEQCIRNIQAILEAAGSSLANVVKTTVYLQDMNDFAAMNATYAKLFPEPCPARATVQVARLPKDAMVEIEAVAIVDERRPSKPAFVYDFKTAPNRRGMGSTKWEQMLQIKPDVAPDVIPFSVADMELKNPPEIVQGLKDFLDTAVLGYTQPTPEYLKAVCGWMQRRHDWTIKPEWICGSQGVVSAFFAAIKAFSEPGDGVIVQTPVYYPFYKAIEANGRSIVRNPLKFDGEYYTIDFEDLERQASDPKNKILLFCSPHNPVGRVWTRDELQRVGDICLAHKVLIISDEIHFDLVMPGYHHTVFATLSEELADNMIVCTAPSKTFNLAGMQTSNIIIPNPALRSRFTAVQASEGFSGLGILGYKACEIGYNECEPWLEQLLSLIEHNHEVLKFYIEKKVPEVKVFDMEGTYLQWMDFRGLGMGKDELEKFLHEEADLFFDEGYIFGEEGTGFERMNLACPTHKVVEAVERLAAAVNRRKGSI